MQRKHSAWEKLKKNGGEEREEKGERKSAVRKMFPADESGATSSTKIPPCFHSTELNTPG